MDALTDQDELIVQLGSSLMSIHADKHDESKDAKYWQDFALQIQKRKAELLGMGQAFDDAVSKGRLRDVLHQMVISELITESKRELKHQRWISFVVGVVAGLILAAFMFR